jgi:hypothetical protein
MKYTQGLHRKDLKQELVNFGESPRDTQAKFAGSAK